MTSESSRLGVNLTIHETVDCAPGLRSLATIIGFLPMAAYVVRAPDGMIVWFNSHATELWGRTPVLGDTDERYCGAHKLYHSDGSFMAHWDTPVALALKTGTSTHEAPVTIEKPDGSRVEVLVHIDPVRDDKGAIVGAVNVFHTNSEQKQAKESALLQQQSEQLRELWNRLQQTQDYERRRVARELHDSAGQLVTALGINLSDMHKYQAGNPSLGQSLRITEELVRQLGAELRTICYLLYPPLLDEVGLSGAIRSYTQGLMERSGLVIDLKISADFPRLGKDMELALFRIVQESLTNIYRHSGSKTAVIRLLQNAENVTLEIQDRGRGMPKEKLAQLRARHAGVGTAGMWERVQQLSGVMDIQSNAHGTTISVAIPVRRADDSEQLGQISRIRAASGHGASA
jgi:signal transduction histidine kinase